jgi:hypothetical protein
MKAGFELKDGSIIPVTDKRAGIFLYTAPDDREKQEIIKTLDLDPYDLESALDL